MREKLIELLTEAELEAEVMCIKQPDCDKCPHAKIGCQSVTIVDHLIANGVTVQKWIPVTERLPDVCDFLVVTDDGIVGEAFRCYGGIYWQEDCLDCDDATPITTNVTHWMPLPEPPKGE